MVVQIDTGLHYIKEVSVLDAQFFDWPWNKDQWSCVNNGYLLNVALIRGQVVGFILFHISIDCAHLLKILVNPENQRQGIAQKLLDYSLLQIEQNLLYLEVSENNLNAIQFYEKNGLSKLVLKRNFYRNGSGAWSMSRDLK